MKNLLMTIAIFLGMYGMAHAGLALNTGDDAKQMEKILSWMVSNPQGISDDGKVAYVIGALGCPYTAKIINGSPEITDDVQLRWIFPESRLSLPETGFVMTDSLPEAFSRVSRGERIRDTREQKDAANYNAALFSTMSPYGFGEGFPLIFFRTKKGLRATNNINDLIKEKDQVIEFAPQPAREIMTKAYQKRFDKKVKVTNRSKKVMNAYFLPDVNSPMPDPKEFGLKPGQYMEWTCSNYNDDFFMCLNPYNKLRFFYKKNK